MRVLIAGGGSAGHVNPALAIAKEIRKKQEDTQILFVGSVDGLEKDLVPLEGFDIKFIQIKGFKRSLSFDTIKTFFIMIKGFFQARKIVKQFKPDISIGTGGFVSGPVLLAAYLKKSKIMIHEQNTFPGITNRLLSRISDISLSAYESTKEHFKRAKKIVVTGNLIDTAFENMETYSVSSGLKNIVIIGGSQGAMTINRVVAQMINEFIKKDDFSLIFAPGKKHYDLVMSTIKRDLVKDLPNVLIKDYIYEREKTYKKADLMITRGGAISISEVLAMGKPAIIIPSPFVPDRAQERNAEFIYEKKACEIIYDDETFTAQKLYDKIKKMISNPDALMDLSQRAYALGIKDASVRVFKEYMELYDEVKSIRK